MVVCPAASCCCWFGAAAASLVFPAPDLDIIALWIRRNVEEGKEMKDTDTDWRCPLRHFGRDKWGQATLVKKRIWWRLLSSTFSTRLYFFDFVCLPSPLCFFNSSFESTHPPSKPTSNQTANRPAASQPTNQQQLQKKPKTTHPSTSTTKTMASNTMNFGPEWYVQT